MAARIVRRLWFQTLPRRAGAVLDPETRRMVPQGWHIIPRPKTGRELFAALSEYLGEKWDRRIASVVYVHRNNRAGRDDLCVRLYNTDILRVHPSGLIEVDHGGWVTVTTHKWINTFLPLPWRVSGLKYPALFRYQNGGTVWEFADRPIVIGPRGGIAEHRERFDTYKTWDRECARRNRIERKERKAAKAANEAAAIERARRNALTPEERRAEDIERSREWRETLPTATREKPRRAWKFLITGAGGIRSRYDGSPWELGEWRTDAVIAPCVGLNASYTKVDAWSFVHGDIIADVEIAGRYHDGPQKVTADEMRIIAVWFPSSGDFDRIAQYVEENEPHACIAGYVKA